MENKRKMQENLDPYETTTEQTISDRFHQPLSCLHQIGKIDMSITMIVYKSSTIVLGSCKRESMYDDQHIVLLRQPGT